MPEWDWEAQDALSRRVLVEEPWQTQWRCWHELAGSRHYTFEVYGGGLGAIRGVSKPLPLSVLDIIAWCNAYGLSDDARYFTLNLVKAMDRVFIEVRSSQIKTDLAQSFGK